jgi:ADP-ribosylglycohydrolase
MPHPITEIPNKLADRLKDAKGETILYCDYYYFVLFIDEYAEFWLNGNHLLERKNRGEIPYYVMNFLETNCPKFINFYKNGQYNENSTVTWKENHYYPQNIPEIGNAYSAMIYKIATEKDYDRNRRVIHLHEDWGKGGWAEFETIGEKEVEAFLTLTIFSDTHKKIKFVEQLDCYSHRTTENENIFEGEDLSKHFKSEDLEAVRELADILKFHSLGHKDSRKHSNTIIGAVIGDVIGSVFEWNNIKTTDFNLFNLKCDYTDDTVLTIAVTDCILNKKDFAKTIWEYGRTYRGRGYGGSFRKWLQEDNLKPYGSFGNGSAMRASAVGFAYNDIDTVLEVAKQTAEVTHNHPEGIKGAQATATAIFLARQGKTKQEIKDYITKTFNYNLDFTLDEIRPTYKFDVTCQDSVPQAIVAFLESSDFESAIRLAISIGGDSDTIACITGGIASAYYKEIPTEIIDFVVDKLPSEYIEIMNKFDEQYDRK